MKKKKTYKVSLIGSGKVATALATFMHQSGFTIVEICNRELKEAKILAQKVNTRAIDDIKKLSPEIDLLIIAVKDDAIKKMAEKIKLKNILVVHTSGTVPISALKKCSDSYGVFYPLQTFTGTNKIKTGEIPFLIEGNDEITSIQLEILASKFTTKEKIIYADSEKRKKIHLAAVLVANFTNYLFSEAERILQKEKIDFEILLPLIKQVISNLETSSPSKNQTGPAFRHDQKTIASHLDLLRKNKNLGSVYQLLSDSIQKFPFDKINKSKKK